jgi:homoserine kinase
MRIRVPATTGNIGCGYDAFGLALAHYNYIDCQEAEQASVHIIGQGADHLPTDERNMMLRAAQAVYDAAGRGPAKLTLTAYNNIPLSRGMGSSSSAIVGGLYAANQILGQPLSTEKLLALATEIEGHPDNVAPTILGGFVIIAQDNGTQRLKRLALPTALTAVLAIPDFTLSTKKSRAILPQKVPLADAVFNLSHGVMLALALAEGDLPGFGAMLKDRLHQPYRFGLIPGALEVIAAANAQGALGCVISGSGPTMVAFHGGKKELGEAIGQAMKQAFAAHRIKARFIQVGMDNQGTQLEEPSID